MTDEVERLRRNHRPSFLAYLGHPDEAGLRDAYELGRNAMAASVSLLDVVRVHHDTVLDLVASARDLDEAQRICGASAAYLVELVSAFEIAQRGFMDLRRAGPGSGR